MYKADLGVRTGLSVINVDDGSEITRLVLLELVPSILFLQLWMRWRCTSLSEIRSSNYVETKGRSKQTSVGALYLVQSIDTELIILFPLK